MELKHESTIFKGALTPKGLRVVFFKRLFLAQEALLRKVDRTDCEIITFEVERKVFFHCA
jgi:hypothetical protein